MAAVFFSRPAESDSKRLAGPVHTALRDDHIPRLRANPRAGKPLHGPLRGYFSYEFWASGTSYRIAYEIMNGDVIVIMLDTRDNFYKKLTRRIS